ncbi:CHAT domain-containing tetratricopeptide repeat protein [Amycolatopsis sp.]|uniref:CHAT domain-containing protein n=1 Tax=Amycolatopsis sp. TaxID=37632 RepID=UPI002E0200A1|nr:CHAT domain-containing tetratricopeptide repeat protein [Amycolatopsis sp.]
MSLLESIHPVDADYHDEWLVVRIRLSSTLAFWSSETRGGVASGLAGLDDVRLLTRGVSDPGILAELSGAIDHNYGLLLMASGRNEDSIRYFDASIEHQEWRLANTAEPAALLGGYLNTLSTRGMAYTRLGDVKRAREDLTRAIATAEKGELSLLAADIRRRLGALELRIGDVPVALSLLEKSERAYRAIPAEIPPLLRWEQAQALLTAGLADEAGRYLDDVLPTMREKHSLTRDLGSVELFRAVAALMQDDLDLARRSAASARRRTLRWGCLTCVAEATVVALRADVRDALSSHDIPPTLSARVLRAAKAMPPRLTEQAGLARMLATRLEIARGKLKRAAELLAQVPRPGQVTSIDYRMLRRLCRAELAAAEGNQRKALTEIRAGLTELDRVRDRMGGLELVSGTALHGQELADLAVKLVLAGANAKRLFDWLERTRAQTYRYEPLADSEDPELADRVAEVRGLSQAIHQAQHDGHPTAALEARHAERLREAHRLGWHSGRWGKPRPVVDLADVAEQLGERALVSFASSGDELVAVIVAGGKSRLVRLGSTAQAAQSARTLNADLDALAPDNLPPMLVTAVLSSARKQADRLDEQLIAPLAESLGDRELVIVPTGALYAVPWGVLPSLHTRPTVVAPSATAWVAAEHTETPRARKVVLVRGPGLLAAQGELDKLATHYRTAKVLDGKRATVKSVLQALDGAKLAHIAAHGAHEPENALFSRLEMTDGALYAHEMAGLKQPPRQVVFAACELALNRIRPGDEALGFASALLAAGSRTVIAPLSRVGDQASAAAMDDYHRGLAGGASPATALADAIAIDPFRRPFVCLGAG